ncbi:MAG: PilZ domain-containing protein [Hydrogenothermaceae bacterium]|nr:PilZ domain-containing protein [Hydrogenothermaceae bacterium]
MEEKGTVKSLIDKIKKDKKLEIYLFYHEAPIRQILEISDIDKNKKQIEFKINGKIDAAVNESREVYTKFGNDIFVLRPLIWNREFLITSFPSFAIEPKLNRNYPRVKCSNKNPITMEDIEIGLCLHIRDISEGGIGFKIDKNIDIKENNIHKVKLNINGKEYDAKIKIVYKTQANGDLYKIGAKFIEPSVKLEDAIAKYVFDRQMEIAKILNTFMD